MAYNELIKNFEKVRAYMREFYVYGFKSRTEYDAKSARSYDDERRRLESWLGDYMRFTQTPEGKNVFLSVDSRVTRKNPFYKAWKAKSFTDGDITLHFAIFDILYDPETKMTLTELIEEIDQRLSSSMAFDESTLRKKLKEYAVSKELLMMGPDCGTAVVNGLPLAFANVIHRGPIGICGASGTGTQELTILIDQLGSGITQALGTGGRDLKAEIGGLMFKQCLNALINDPETKVIIMLSKPPADHVAKEILAIAKECNDHIKPVVVDFIGGDPNLPKEYGLTAAYNLEDAARKAVALSKGEPVPADMIDIDMPKAELEALIERETAKMAPTQKYYRGFFSGGTLADESMKLSIGKLGHIYSNIPLKPEDKIENPLTAEYKENTCIDFGEDEFTEGKPHPMIDLTLRCERILRDAHDPTLAILQCDCVIGYGSNANPAEELSAAIKEAKAIAEREGRYISAICSIVGTEGDPQNLTETRKQLEAAGAIVVRYNAQSTYLVHHMLDKLNGGKY